MIAVNVSRAERSFRITKKTVETIVRFVLKKEKHSAGNIHIIFVNDKIIFHINKNFLHHYSTTDVITFSLGEHGELYCEIYVNIVQARRQAKKYKVSMKNELIRLIVHGLLHAVGYDDLHRKQKEKMVRIQEQYVAELSSML